MKAALCLLSALLLVPLVAEAGEVLVDRIVATVGDTPITASEVGFEAAVRERIRGLEPADRTVFGRLLLEEREPLEAVVFRAILVESTEYADVQDPDERVAYDRFRAFEDTFADRSSAAAFRKSWGLSRVEALDWFRIYARLDETVETAVARSVRVTEEDERRYHDANVDRVFGGRSFEDVREDVARAVSAQKFDQAYQSWRKRVRAGARLRYLR